MNKKAMPIYSLGLIVLFFARVLLAEDDIASYCFEADVSIRTVRQSIDFILTDKDKVSYRNDDNCLDIITSENRKKILDKFIARKYRTKTESTAMTTYKECHLDLKTTTKKKINSNTLNLGEKNNVAATETSGTSVSNSSLLLGSGLQGSLTLATQTLQKIADKDVLVPGGVTLQVTCAPSGSDGFNLTFYFDDKNKASVSTSLYVKTNEVINVANVTNTLNDKNKTLGIPQVSIGSNEGTEEITYELKVY